jgi:predicted TIM-barrel fold metal-dependent hydrolase
MSHFVFSADGHVVEPQGLLMTGLPPELQQYGLHPEKDGEYMLMKAGDKVLSKMRFGGPPRKEIKDEAGDSFSRGNRLGVREIPGRLVDMEHEGIDAEIVFPSAGLMIPLIENGEAEFASCQVYNDWNSDFFKDHLDTFVRCGVLPVHNFDYTVAEIKRLSEKGFTTAMLPSLIETNSGLPLYNDPSWDQVFEAGEQYNMVFVLHTGTGREDVRGQKGPGGAVVNYTIQMCDAQHSIMHMVAGGVLDRFPSVKVAAIESGASWLPALAERMDEVYEAHHWFVKPKLSITPREIIARQVSASFQYDRACIMARSVIGHQCLMWGADYPHHEGTFPRSKEVVANLFDGIDITEEEKDGILGVNAARLFRLPRPEFTKAA